MPSGDAHVWSRDEDGNREHGGGTVTLKRAFIVSNSTAFGLEVDAKLPTAKRHTSHRHAVHRTSADRPRIQPEKEILYRCRVH